MSCQCQAWGSRCPKNECSLQPKNDSKNTLNKSQQQIKVSVCCIDKTSQAIKVAPKIIGDRNPNKTGYACLAPCLPQACSQASCSQLRLNYSDAFLSQQFMKGDGHGHLFKPRLKTSPIHFLILKFGGRAWNSAWWKKCYHSLPWTQLQPERLHSVKWYAKIMSWSRVKKQENASWKHCSRAAIRSSDLVSFTSGLCFSKSKLKHIGSIISRPTEFSVWHVRKQTCGSDFEKPLLRLIA